MGRKRCFRGTTQIEPCGSLIGTVNQYRTAVTRRRVCIYSRKPAFGQQLGEVFHKSFCTALSPAAALFAIRLLLLVPSSSFGIYLNYCIIYDYARFVKKNSKNGKID